MAEIYKIGSDDIVDRVSTFGGTNLVTGSNTNDLNLNKWYHSNAVGGTTRIIEIENGVPCVKITRDTTEQSSWHYFHYDGLLSTKIETNTVYTVTFDLKPSVNGSISLSAFMNGNATNSLSKTVTTLQGTLVANQWNHIVMQTTTKDSFEEITIGNQCVYMSLSASLRAVNTWTMMKNIKVEKGNKPTRWTPAPQDLVKISGTELQFY